ncbi:NifU family protein [Nonomuraea soli]|uniref:Fe-S cluster biogenesis protein NfuA n=1 Tax=Nonomuraea soli TaxID=1032476 RepID=A0A7W0CFB0_9ACTN|nr:NifU family protein [Nonomuraea soli]MBA2890128.1 Fe-S cluster biogenesis protein NfuA [Nonomuraea soli]
MNTRAVADALSRVMRSHGGALTLLAQDDGVVTVRMGGMCGACPAKPGCLEATIRPALLAVEGVRDVVAEGSRLDPAAHARLRRFLEDPDDRNRFGAGQGQADPGGVPPR